MSRTIRSVRIVALASVASVIRASVPESSIAAWVAGTGVAAWVAGAGVAAWVAASSVAAADLPVRARAVESPRASVELTNVGTHAITAWAFEVVSPNPQGGEHREVHSADVYLSEVTRGLPRSEEHLDWLRPGQSRIVPVDAIPANAKVEVIALILADGNAMGDATVIKAFFANRALERDELHKIVEAFDAVLPGQRGLAALAALQQRLAAEGPDESVPHRAAREAVQAYFAKAKAGREDEADRSLRMYAAFVERQYELAVKHASPARSAPPK